MHNVYFESYRRIYSYNCGDGLLNVHTHAYCSSQRRRIQACTGIDGSTMFECVPASLALAAPDDAAPRRPPPARAMHACTHPRMQRVHAARDDRARARYR